MMNSPNSKVLLKGERSIRPVGKTSSFSCVELNVNDELSSLSSFALGSAHEKFDA
jgi:hypothetical protein